MIQLCMHTFCKYSHNNRLFNRGHILGVKFDMQKHIYQFIKHRTPFQKGITEIHL